MKIDGICMQSAAGKPGAHHKRSFSKRAKRGFGSRFLTTQAIMPGPAGTMRARASALPLMKPASASSTAIDIRERS